MNDQPIFALFLYDKHSLEGVGFKICRMTRQEYEQAIKAIHYLNTHGKPTASVVTCFDTEEEAMKEARASFSLDVWNSLL